MTVGDILLYKGNSKLARIVRRIMGGKYTHCEVYIGDGKSLDVNQKGISKKHLTVDIMKEVDVWRPEWKTKSLKILALDWAINQQNIIKGYGFGNLIAFLYIKRLRQLKIRWYEGNKFVTCSEFVADYCTVGRISKRKDMPKRLKDIPNSLVAPDDEPKIFRMKLIKEGG